MEESNAERVKHCIRALRSAKNDTELFAALLVTTKVKAEDCDRETRRQVFDAVGFDVISRLLKTTDVPQGCPEHVYRAIALTLLSCFCTEPEFASHPTMLELTKEMVDLVGFAKDYNDDDDHGHANGKAMVLDALQCFASIAVEETGCKALIENGVVPVLCMVVSEKAHCHEEGMNVLMRLLATCGSSCWVNNVDSFHDMMNRLAVDFNEETSSRKFQLCDYLVSIMQTFPKNLVEDDCSNRRWNSAIHQGLCDILFSKLVPQMDVALRLTSVMIECLGVSWAIGETERSKQFFLIFIHLACIEVRMIVEERSLEQVVEDRSVLIACFSSLESAISYLVSDAAIVVDQQQKQHLYVAITSAMNGLIYFLSVVSKAFDAPFSSLDDNKQLLLHACVRIIGIWLAEETSALRDEVYEVLPVLLDIASHSIGNQTSQNFHSVPEVLRFLLPAMCHFSCEDKAREILCKLNFHRLLLNYLSSHWKHFLSHDKCGDSENVMITICGIFMNIVVLEPELVSVDPIFHELLQFTFRTLPDLENAVPHLVLIGNVAVLGLLLLRHYASKVKPSETIIYRYLSSSIKFLWDAYHVDDSIDLNSVVITHDYRKVWDQIQELWFLGMQALSTVLPKMAWITQFILETGWNDIIIGTLSKISEGGVDASVKSAFENLLCCLVTSGDNVGQAFKNQGALEVRQYLCDRDMPDLVAKETVEEYLRCFRANPQDPVPGRTDLDSWRRLQWAYALGPEWEYLTEKVYPLWKKARFDNLGFSDQVKSMLKSLRRRFKLALITNGPSKAQWEKIQKVNAREYFDLILVSGDVGVEKPDPAIFQLAFDDLRVSPEECIMIGDRLNTDIQGGLNAGLAATIWVPLKDSDRPVPAPDFKLTDGVSGLLSLLSSANPGLKLRRSSKQDYSTYKRSDSSSLKDCSS